MILTNKLRFVERLELITENTGKRVQKGAVLDRAVANAMGFKSVHNCEKWGENMTGFQRKQAVAQAKLTEDDDIQDYKKPWVGLTDDEVDAAWGAVAWHSGKGLPELRHEYVRAIEQLLKEKNA